MENSATFFVRIEGLTLKNFKNIGNGSIYFDEFKKIERKDLTNLNLSNVLGIYGQNASGKTSIINALEIIRHILSGGGMAYGIKNYIRKGYNNLLISITFLLTKGDQHIVAYYDIEFKLTEKEIYIEKESLSYSTNKDNLNRLGDKKTAFGFSYIDGIKKSFLSNVDSKEDVTILKYLATQKKSTSISELKPTLFSILFNKETVDIISKQKNLYELSIIIKSLNAFCKNKFLIVTTKMYDGINDRGLAVNGFNIDENQDKIHKMYSIMFGKQILELNKYNEFKKMLNLSGKVLTTLVPGLSIEPHIYNETIDSNGNKAIVFEVMSLRNGVETPLYFESRGVKQMLTYVGDLIEVFNEEGTFIAIDEFDSGLFEYLLGELVYSFDNFAFGQLLFTSHNFRILEKIKSNEIFFTTTDDMNKFVQPKNIKANNNLRDVYYRLIAQGEENLNYYNKTSFVEINKTLSLLGKNTE